MAYLQGFIGLLDVLDLHFGSAYKKIMCEGKEGNPTSMFYYFFEILIQYSILNLGYECLFWSLKGILKTIKRQEIDSAL